MKTQRPLVLGHPDLDRGTRVVTARKAQRQGDHAPQDLISPVAHEISGAVDRLLGADLRRILVIGCGARPVLLHSLRNLGHDVRGVEAVSDYVIEANNYLGRDCVVTGCAEALPSGDATVDVVVMHNVLEHFDAPATAIAEAYRVLSPGGVLYIYTTNRWQVSLTGKNSEYTVPFFNWLPAIVKEAYVYHHFQHDPRLANYSRRPGVHWFNYPDLCALGRGAGFAQFYARIDLLSPDDEAAKRWPGFQAIHRLMQRSPWVRAAVLTQFGSGIYMIKRAAQRFSTIS